MNVKKFFPADKNYLLKEAQVHLENRLRDQLIDLIKELYFAQFNPLGLEDDFIRSLKKASVKDDKFLEKPYEKHTLVTAITNAFEQLDTETADDRRSKDAQARLSALTPREMEVLECLVAGLTNKGIAQALSISPRTVEIHRAHMMEKLEAESLSSALRLAFVAGIGSEQA